MMDDLGFEDLKGKNNYGSTGPVILLVLLLIASIGFGLVVYKQFFDIKTCDSCSVNNTSNDSNNIDQEMIDKFFNPDLYYLGFDEYLYKRENTNSYELKKSFDREKVVSLEVYGSDDKSYQMFLTRKGNLYIINDDDEFIKLENNLDIKNITSFDVIGTKLIINEEIDAELDVTCSDTISDASLVELGSSNINSCHD